MTIVSSSQKCWEYNKCGEQKKKKCEIFNKGTGEECVFNYCPLENCKYASKYGGCMGCPWFFKSDFMENIGKSEILNIIK